MLRVAIDVMGGDNAPDNPIKGSLIALQKIPDLSMVLVGDHLQIEEAVSKLDFPDNRVEIIHASQVVRMSDSPIKAVQRKKDSSIAVALTLHRMGKVQAVVSAGNTGTQVIASVLKLGRMNGVLRPVIGSLIPTNGRPCFLLDIGANMDCRSVYLFQFGIMGAIFVQAVLGIENPRVGILSIGSEKNKGNAVSLFAHHLLKESHLNFIGNIEGSDILCGKADVAVCDGFVGNLLLKFAESFPGFILGKLENAFRDKDCDELENFFDEQFNPESYGGVPILGINGVSVVCHGSASPLAIASAIKVAVEMVDKSINELIADQLSKLRRFYAMNKYFHSLLERWEERQNRIYWNSKRLFNWFYEPKPGDGDDEDESR
ncbi:MAG: phosphate acyltransferase PlsX [candidate division Zixibacteria bacterium]|nr:phosphate acyltransferase PlsX [Candidatus Tariuqbacter arcticus]